MREQEWIYNGYCNGGIVSVVIQEAEGLRLQVVES